MTHKAKKTNGKETNGKETNIGPRHWSELYPHNTKISTKPPYENIAAIDSPVISTIIQKLLDLLHMKHNLNSVLVYITTNGKGIF